jgi:hypothetical protein
MLKAWHGLLEGRFVDGLEVDVAPTPRFSLRTDFSREVGWKFR